MFELSILSLLTVVSASSLSELPLVVELPPQALQKAAMVSKARIVKVRRIRFPFLTFKAFIIQAAYLRHPSLHFPLIHRLPPRRRNNASTRRDAR